MEDNLYIAIDLGAGSGRVFLCGLGENEFKLEEIHRFIYPPIEENGRLRWDFAKIFLEIKFGLSKSSERAGELNRKIYSLGIDSWAVDYGLLDKAGSLLANPVCYRDGRTDGAIKKVFRQVSRERIYEKTGIQFLKFNTIYQLAADENLKNARKILLLPDLINFFLTGKTFAEYTNAATTQLVNAKTRNWDCELLDKLNLSADLFPEIIAAGKDLGYLKSDLAAELDLKNVRVIAPATHDTASAVAGILLEKKDAFISSGTWSLVGVEREEVLINEKVARKNFTNEGGAFGTIRFLKNVAGLWIFESCRRQWREHGIESDYETLLREAAAIKDFQGFIFPDDERFTNPPDMLNAIAGQLNETGQNYDNPVWVTKIILDSLAFRYASVLRTIEISTGENLEVVQIGGGGGRNNYLNQMTANACNLPVQAGLTEATVTGNVLVQAITAGRFENLQEARQYVKENVTLTEFSPRKTVEIQMAMRRYAEIKTRFVD